MKTIILKVGWCGLGDHLLLSPLPRIAKQVHQYDKVFITNHSDFSRDSQIKKLVWEMNPYVDGFCDEDSEWPRLGGIGEGQNVTDKIMINYGLDDGLRFHNPEIYYKPKFIPELKDAIIYDPNYCTNARHPSAQMIDRYFKQNNIVVTHQMRLFNKSLPIDCERELCDTSLFHFCDMIYSCKALYCLNTGTHLLSASMGKPTVVLCGPDCKQRFLGNIKLHTYVKLERN
jgi:hypothetical protein